MSFSFSGEYGENPLVEQPSIQLFGSLGWDTTDEMIVVEARELVEVDEEDGDQVLVWLQ